MLGTLARARRVAGCNQDVAMSGADSHHLNEQAEPQGSIHVLVLAAQPVVRVGVRRLLEGRPSVAVTGEAGRLAEGTALVPSLVPHVILLDPDCEDFSLQAVSTFRELGRVPVLVFTGTTDPAMHGHAVALGAMGVVEKRHSADTLGRAVEKVHAGEVWLERRAAANMVQEMTRRNSDPEALKIATLTKREREVIGLIGSGLKSEAIANRLFISQATVRNHLTSILGKLELADRFELAFYARQHGLAGLKDELGHAARLRVPRAAPASVDDLIGFAAAERRRNDRRLSRRA